MLEERTNVRRAALAIAPAVMIAGVGGGMAFPILPVVGAEAGLSLHYIGFILAANRIGRVFSNSLVGTAVDRFGGKLVLTIGCLLQIVVLALYILGIITYNPGPFFLFGRLLHGPASASVFVASQTLALHLGGAKHRGLATGIVSSALSAGTPLGLVVGGLLSGFIGPQGAFEVTLAAPLLAALAAHHFVPNIRSPSRGRVPMAVAMQSLGDARVAIIAGINFTTSFAANGVVLASLAFLVKTRRIDLSGLPHQAASGTLMAVLVIATMIITPMAGRISDWAGWRARLALAGLITLGVGLILVRESYDVRLLAVGLGLVGAGSGAISVPLLALVGDIIASDRRGSAIGALQLFTDLGGTAGPIAGTYFLATSDTFAYSIAATLVAVMLPSAWWLASWERRALQMQAAVITDV